MALSDDEIIAMGNEAALQHGHTYEPEPADGTIEFLGSFAAMVAAKEREACAQVCNATYYQFIGPEFGEVRHGIAACSASIRAMGTP